MAVIAAASWWLLRDDDERLILAAHEDLIRLLRKSEDDEAISLLDVRALQALFASRCEVSGDDEGFSGNYSAEDMVRMILGVKAQFRSIDLSISEPVIMFSGDDEATAEFSAVLNGSQAYQGSENVIETRDIRSRLRYEDGNWRFAGFILRRTNN